MSEEKTTLADIWSQFHFDCKSLADKAEVNFIVVYKMVRDAPVARWQAEDMLNALSQLTGKNYSLDTVKVVLYPEPK
jgi:hypothetical protein